MVLLERISFLDSWAAWAELAAQVTNRSDPTPGSIAPGRRSSLLLLNCCLNEFESGVCPSLDQCFGELPLPCGSQVSGLLPSDVNCFYSCRLSLDHWSRWGPLLPVVQPLSDRRVRPERRPSLRPPNAVVSPPSYDEGFLLPSGDAACRALAALRPAGCSMVLDGANVACAPLPLGIQSIPSQVR